MPEIPTSLTGSLSPNLGIRIRKNQIALKGCYQTLRSAIIRYRSSTAECMYAKIGRSGWKIYLFRSQRILLIDVSSTERKYSNLLLRAVALRVPPPTDIEPLP